MFPSFISIYLNLCSKLGPLLIKSKYGFKPKPSTITIAEKLEFIYEVVIFDDMNRILSLFRDAISAIHFRCSSIAVYFFLLRTFFLDDSFTRFFVFLFRYPDLLEGTLQKIKVLAYIRKMDQVSLSKSVLKTGILSVIASNNVGPK